MLLITIIRLNIILSIINHKIIIKKRNKRTINKLLLITYTKLIQIKLIRLPLKSQLYLKVKNFIIE